MFLATVKSTISRYRMIGRGETVVVAVSGGADSVALLHALWSLRQDFGIDLVAAHLNHGIRGEEADADAAFVQELASGFGVPSVVEKVDLPRIRRQLRMGMEEAARKVRYEFLERVAESAQAARIAVAHTVDDQVETVLLNIIRGTGPDGLAGMPAARGKIVRPLIELFRSDVESYLKENDIAWRVDVTNLELDYTRNRVRLRLIPMLEKTFNPRVKDAVLSLSKLARDEAEVVREEAFRTFDDAAREVGDEAVVFDAERFGALPQAIKRRCLMLAIERVKGDLRDVEYEQVERVIDSLDRGEDFTLTLPSGRVYAALSAGLFRIFAKVQVQKIDLLRRMESPGRTEVPELDIAIEARFVPPETRPTSETQAVIDLSRISGDLFVKTWRAGDEIVPLGMAGHKKLQDLFTDRKIPRFERQRIPLVIDSEKIVWVVGVIISDTVKVTDKTNMALWMEALPIS
ncbi:MAG: tRNA lysidine(34) synthetase TilS [Armatimonadetes bacterium]|nr:tRNA lysidine(34) synthetase TilS [Armatimonadota bacterium]